VGSVLLRRLFGIIYNMCQIIYKCDCHKAVA